MIEASIILLTYNRAYIVGESIQSVLNQSFKDFELIIIDDGSDDETQAVVYDYDDSRIKYYYFKHCGNLSILRNQGIKLSKGKYLAFLDSDDTWGKDKLKLQIEMLEQNPFSCFCFTNVKELNKERILKNDIYPFYDVTTKKNFFMELILGKMYIYPSTLVFRSKCLEKIGSMVNELPLSDNEFMYRLAYHEEGILCKQTLVNIRKQADSFVKAREEEVWEEMIYSINRFFSEKKLSKRLYRRELSKAKYKLAIVLGLKNEFKKSLQLLCDCISLSPLSLKAYMRIFWLFFKF